MARISLRAYNQQIEKLIDRAQIEEAIAHCRHILEEYPKHISTYRVLGKAFLEGQRFGDAADIFQRVLSAVPDDFVSHVGMSIIREDEGNLDAAIWHMERAFEVQPANAAIQQELRRLYGKRDGLEPPKVYLTRGALARLYAKGDLHPQSIAELRAALSDDPQRPDLLVLLAGMYFSAGQLVESAEVCSSLIEKLPHCMEANLILSKVLEDSKRASEAETYFQRVQDLDPYTAFLSPANPKASQVPDNAINLEFLEWKPGAVVSRPPAQPGWAASLGLDMPELAPKEGGLPDWLSQPTGPETGEFPAEPKAIAEVPDWIEAAGWAAISEEEQAPTLDFDFETTTEEELAPAEIPDWLQAMAPAKTSEEEAAIAPKIEEIVSRPAGMLEEQQPGLPDWITRVEAEGPAAAEEGEMPDWLSSLTTEAEVVEAEVEPTSFPADEEAVFIEEEAEIPDWLRGVTGEAQIAEREAAPAELESEVPDWLRGLTEEEPVAEVEAAPVVMPRVEPAVAPEAEEEIPDWLRDLIEEIPAAEARVAPTPAIIEAEAEIPDWLREFADEIELAPTALPPEEVTAPVEAEAEIPEWMREFAVEAPAEEVQIAPVIAALEEPELPPVEEIEAIEVEEEVEITPEPAVIEPIEEIVPTVVEAQPILSLEDETAAMAWLESLAAKQGALEEELLIAPEERKEAPPEWAQVEEAIPEEVLPGVPLEAEVISFFVEEEAVEEAAPIEEAIPEEVLPEIPLEAEVISFFVEEEAIEEAAPIEEAIPEEVLPEIPLEAEAISFFVEEEAIEEAAPIEEVIPEEVLPEVPLEAEAISFFVEEEAIEEAAPTEEAIPEEAALEVPTEFVEEVALEVEEYAWVPPAVAAEMEALAVEAEAELPTVAVDLNTASLRDLERIAGVGFILAQNIIEYRDNFGPFSSLEELRNVSGMDEDTLAQIERHTTLEVVTILEAPESVEAGPEETILDQARQAIEVGDLTGALGLYTSLITEERYLDEIIHDLQQVAPRYPREFYLLQALGDACVRNDLLQEALDAYSEAEKLLVTEMTALK